MIPGGQRLTEGTLRRRLKLNHNLGHIVPKPAKLFTDSGILVHTADRARLVQAQQAFVRLLEDAVAPHAAEAYQEVTGTWQAAWLSERQAALNWLTGSQRQARSVAKGQRGFTTLDDVESAFSSLKRDGIFGLYKASCASSAYVNFRKALHAGDSRQDPESAVPTVGLIMQGRSTDGPPMYDGFIQGSRFSCWDMLFAMETVHRLWQRLTTLDDIAMDRRVQPQWAGIKTAEHPRRMPNHWEVQQAISGQVCLKRPATATQTTDPTPSHTEGSHGNTQDELAQIRQLGKVTQVLRQTDLTSPSTKRPRGSFGPIGGPVKPKPPGPHHEDYWAQPLSIPRVYRIGEKLMQFFQQSNDLHKTCDRNDGAWWYLDNVIPEKLEGGQYTQEVNRGRTEDEVFETLRNLESHTEYYGLSEGKDDVNMIIDDDDNWRKVWDERRADNREPDELWGTEPQTHIAFPPDPPSEDQIQQGLATKFVGIIAPDPFAPPTTGNLEWGKWWHNRISKGDLQPQQVDQVIPPLQGDDEDEYPLLLASNILGYGDDLCLVSERGLGPYLILWDTLKILQPLLGIRFLPSKHRTLSNCPDLNQPERDALVKLGIPQDHQTEPRAMLTGGITGYDWTKAHWYERARERLQERMPGWTAKGYGANDKHLIWKFYLNRLTSFVGQVIPKDATERKHWHLHRRRFLGVSGHVQDAMLPYLKYLVGAPEQVEHDELRELGAGARIAAIMGAAIDSMIQEAER